MSICCMCGKEFKDKHPERKTPEDKKTCSRNCYYDRLRRDGSWNKNKKWNEIYSPETLKKMEDRIHTTGEKHFNWDIKRPDVVLRNLADNPMIRNKPKKEIQEIKRKILENLSNNALNELLKGIGANKVYAYQRKAWNEYGRKCAVCGKVTGQIDVHHIDGNRKHNKLDNLIVLCASHHAMLHKRNLTIEQLKKQ